MCVHVRKFMGFRVIEKAGRWARPARGSGGLCYGGVFLALFDAEDHEHRCVSNSWCHRVLSPPMYLAELKPAIECAKLSFSRPPCQLWEIKNERRSIQRP